MANNKMGRPGRKTLNGLFYCAGHVNDDGTKGLWMEPEDFNKAPERAGGKTSDCKQCRNIRGRKRRALAAEGRRLNRKPKPLPPRERIEIPNTSRNILITSAWNSNLNFEGITG